MKQIVLGLFVVFMVALPSLSFADMIVSPPSPEERCSYECRSNDCFDCETNSIKKNNNCKICSRCVAKFESVLKDYCRNKKCEDWCPHVDECYDCENHNKYKDDDKCKECNYCYPDFERYCFDQKCTKWCPDNCYDCVKRKFKTDTGCEECKKCDRYTIEKNCGKVKCETWCLDACYNCQIEQKLWPCPNECENCKEYFDDKNFVSSLCHPKRCRYHCVSNCFDCKNNAFKDELGCKECSECIEPHELEQSCLVRNCKELCDKCFDCKNRTYKTGPGCEICERCTTGMIEPNCGIIKCEGWCFDNCYDCENHKQLWSSSCADWCNECSVSFHDKNFVDRMCNGGASNSSDNSSDTSIAKSIFSCSSLPTSPFTVPITLLFMFVVSLGSFMLARRRDK